MQNSNGCLLHLTLLFFFLLRLTVSCNLSYELWISTLLEIFTSPVVMVLWCQTGLSLEARRRSRAEASARRSAHRLTRKADTSIFSSDVWSVCTVLRINTPTSTSVYISITHTLSSWAGVRVQPAMTSIEHTQWTEGYAGDASTCRRETTYMAPISPHHHKIFSCL